MKWDIADRNQDLQEQEAATLSLREELEKAKQESVEKGSVCRQLACLFLPNTNLQNANPHVLQAELQAELDALHRENRLMTSAWYDMTCRLQSNTVVLQRKSEAPKSWLGKQRAAVGAGALPGRR